MPETSGGCARSGITAAGLLEVNTRADGGAELWLADIGGTAGFDWTVPRLARFARELGTAQARWAGRVPDTPWLSRRWLRRRRVQLVRAGGRGAGRPRPLANGDDRPGDPGIFPLAR